LFVINKCDLGDAKKLQYVQTKLANKYNQCVLLDSTISNSSKILVEKLEILLKEKIQRLQAKGVNIPLKAMIVGVPNSGKSTIANNLYGNKKAITGDKPGVTKQVQWVKISKYLEVLDTPGTLWPAFSNQDVAKSLAYVGSIKDDVLDIEEVALELVKDLQKNEFDLLKNRYSLDEIMKNATPLEIYEQICINRKFILKGNEIDWTRGAKALFDDFRKGRIGKITFLYGEC